MKSNANKKPLAVERERVGTILPKDTLMFRVHVGEAKHQDGRSYEIMTNAGNGSPIVQSVTTGKWFTLSWEEIIRLARLKGIDEA